MHGMHTVYFIKDLSDPPRRLALFRAPLIHGFGAGAEGRWEQPPGAAGPFAERFLQQAVVPLCHLPPRLPKQHPGGWGEQLWAAGLPEEQHGWAAARAAGWLAGRKGWQLMFGMMLAQANGLPHPQLLDPPARCWLFGSQLSLCRRG